MNRRKTYVSPATFNDSVEDLQMVCATLGKGDDSQQPYEPESKERAKDDDSSSFGDLW